LWQSLMQFVGSAFLITERHLPVSLNVKLGIARCCGGALLLTRGTSRGEAQEPRQLQALAA